MGVNGNGDEMIKLTDILSIEELKHAQEAASKMARVAVIITDENGKPVVEGTNFTDFCGKYCRKSEIGRKKCEECDMMGAISALDQGKAVYYYCHANIIEFAAPIMLEGRIIGSFIGGQVLLNQPDYNKIRKIARILQIDEEELAEAASKVPILPKAALERCTEFFFDYAKSLSTMAIKSYTAIRESREALKAATAKTDFLANMSHEIRTPMNAIIGMSEIALREEMSGKAREYIRQVSNSAEMLLTIINDILDYSKLDAGKMTIVDSDYSPAALLKDVGNIIINRIGNKNIEYIVDIDPSMPSELVGDDIRLKQILVNLINNAVKFTNEGQIKLNIKYKSVNEKNILLRCDVSDTGIGIKKENLERLFNSFEQVDSRRNRKVEGTGLGLAIVKELVEAMHGKIMVESQYGRGSTFSFEIPQAIANSERLVKFTDECPSVVGMLVHPYFKKQIRVDMERIGAQYIDAELETAVGIFDGLHVDYGIIDEELTGDIFRQVTKNHTHTIFFVICGDTAKDYSDLPNVRVLRRPVNVLNLATAIMNIKFDSGSEENTESALDFKAPEADILIVDDNEINLSVAAGLLEPLEMKIDTAESGFKALDMVAEKKYDIVFMDHMMPDMDGIETAKEIRKKYPAYADVPIVALTANALASSREELLMNGMSDFVAKPIVLSSICGVIKKWLPKEKIVTAGAAENNGQKTDTDKDSKNSIIGKLDFLNTKLALDLLKTEKLYMKVLKDYYQMIPVKHDKIAECLKFGNIPLYTVEVHALKSTSRQIGATELGDMAEMLEAAGKAADTVKIASMTGEMLEKYLLLKKQLEPFFGENQENGADTGTRTNGSALTKEQVEEKLDLIAAAIDELNLDAAEEAADELAESVQEEEQAELAAELREALVNMDLDSCTEILEKWKSVVKQ